MRVSILDQSPISEGATGPEALANTLDLAQRADRLGYHRYWLAEHHGGTMLAGPSPEVLIGPVAAATERMRVGSGGVMLPHYSPLKVAESFSLLSGLYPGRIDLGLGRAPGTDGITSFALQRDRRQPAADDFPQQLAELLGYLYDRLPDDHPFARLAQLPGLPERPEPWLLGSSPQSAVWAGQLSLPYSFAHFINPDGAELAAIYRQRFEASEALPSPRQMVAVWAVAADTDEEAERLALSSKMAMTLLRRGQLIPVPPVEKAERFFQNHELPGGRRAIAGSPDRVRGEIERIAADYEAEEVMVVTIVHDHVARRRSYELIAEEMDLSHTSA